MYRRVYLCLPVSEYILRTAGTCVINIHAINRPPDPNPSTQVQPPPCVRACCVPALPCVPAMARHI